jgi:hypothetical protein
MFVIASQRVGERPPDDRLRQAIQGRKQGWIGFVAELVIGRIRATRWLLAMTAIYDEGERAPPHHEVLV